MKNQEIVRQIQRLHNLIKKTDDACGGNIEMQASWAKYICVLSAGLLENALKEIYVEYATRTVSKPVANFVSSSLSSIRNPKTEKFILIAAAFKDAWKTDLENYVSMNGREEALNSIMNHRHLIAHGQERNSTISLAQIKDYLTKAVEVLEFIEEQCHR